MISPIVQRCPVCFDPRLTRFDRIRSMSGPDTDILLCPGCLALVNESAYAGLAARSEKQIQMTDFYAVGDEPAEAHLEEITKCQPFFDYLLNEGFNETDFAHQVFCDFGAGRGYVAMAAAQRFRTSYACEWDTASIGRIRDALARADVTYANLHVARDMAEIKEPIDLLFMWHALEHLPNPTEFWRSRLGQLSDKAAIFLQIPLYRPQSVVDVHFVFHTEKSLSRWAKNIGFAPVKLAYDTDNGFLGMVARRSA